MIGRRFRNWFDDTRLISPRRALLHPAFLVAVFVLVVNDHVLKHSDLAGFATGKLSDFAGLFFAPVLLAALLGVKSRRALGLCALATAVCFGLINTSTSFATRFDALASLVYPFHTTVDPTDLIALLAIPLGVWVLEPHMSAASAPLRRLFEYASLTIAGLSSIATSPGPCNGVAECGGGVPDFSAQVSILNKSNELHELRVRVLRPEVALDCDIVETDPDAYLPDAVFGPPQTWLLQSGQEIPVEQIDEFAPTPDGRVRDCRAALVQTDSAPDILVFWDAGLPRKWFPFDADIPQDVPADPQTVVLEADYSDAAPGATNPWRNRSDCGARADLCSDDVLAPLAEIPPGARYSWSSSNEPKLHFVRSPVLDGPVDDIPEACQMPDPGSSLTWESPPGGDLVVVGLEPGLDGCHQLRLLPAWATEEDDVEPRGWWLCAPFDQVATLAPGEDGSSSRIAVVEIQSNSTAGDGPYTGLRIDVTQRQPDRLLDEYRKLYFVRGHGLPPEIDFGFTVESREGCDPIETICGQMALPADAILTTFPTALAPGESVSFDDPDPVDVHIVRAEYRPVRDSSCEAEAPVTIDGTATTQDLPGYFETVIATH